MALGQITLGLEGHCNDWLPHGAVRKLLGISKQRSCSVCPMVLHHYLGGWAGKRV